MHKATSISLSCSHARLYLLVTAKLTNNRHGLFLVTMSCACHNNKNSVHTNGYFLAPTFMCMKHLHTPKIITLFLQIHGMLCTSQDKQVQVGQTTVYCLDGMHQELMHKLFTSSRRRKVTRALWYSENYGILSFTTLTPHHTGTENSKTTQLVTNTSTFEQST